MMYYLGLHDRTRAMMSIFNHLDILTLMLNLFATRNYNKLSDARKKCELERYFTINVWQTVPY